VTFWQRWLFSHGQGDPSSLKELKAMNADGRLGRRTNFLVGSLVLTALWIATVLGVRFLLT
jgi:hypothetical protein